MNDFGQVDYIIPFYSNTPDDTHCFQAALKMVLKYYWPSREFSWEELDTVTAKVPDLWTSPAAGLIWLVRNGFEVINIDPFESQRFIDQGAPYLLEYYGNEVGSIQIEHMDIEQEQRYAKEFLSVVKFEERIPNKQEIKEFLSKGYLVICNVNSLALDHEEGYSGHFIVIKGFDDNDFILNDPGLPGQENRKVDFETFEKAWAYPDAKSKNITAVKLP